MQTDQARVIKVKAHTRRAPAPKPQAAPGDVAAGQRYAKLGASIAQNDYAQKSLKQRKASVAAAHDAGGNRTRAQRVILATHGERTSGAGEGRGALAKRYSSVEAGRLLAQTHPTKVKVVHAPDNQSIIQDKLKQDQIEAAGLRLSLKGVKAPWFNSPVKNAVNFTMEQLQRPSTAIGAQIKGVIENPAGLPGHQDTAAQGFLHPQEHARDWNDAVRAAGIKNKYVNSAVALTASIATDPTTYLAFGTTTLAREAGAAAAKRALETGATREEAIRLGRKAAESTGKGGEKRGVQVGFRGGPARLMGKRIVMSKPLSGPTRARLGAAATKAGVKHVGGQAVTDIFEGARKTFMNPNVRPRGWKDYEYEIAREAGNTGRAGERAAQRNADQIKVALGHATHGWTQAQHDEVLHALDHSNPASLNPDQQKVYDAVKRVREVHSNGPIGPEFDQMHMPTMDDTVAPRPSVRGVEATKIPDIVHIEHLAHGRALAQQETHRWLAGLADPINLRAADAKSFVERNPKVRLFAKDHTGKPLPLYNAQTGEVSVGKLISHINMNHEISAVHGDKVHTIENLIKGGVTGREHDPADLLRPEPGESRANFLSRAHQTWKWWATAPNPSYHMRNAVGDTFNALIAGTQINDFRHALRMNQADWRIKKIESSIDSPEGTRAMNALHKASQRSEHYDGVGGELTDLEVLGLANKYGAVNSGIVSGELRAMQEGNREGAVVEGLHLQGPRDAIQKVGDYRENIARLATFRNGLKRGMTPPEAAAFSLRHHIDYSNLSRAEVSFWRYVVPFWSWWSRNLPLQVRSVGANPGLYANVEKARRQSLIAAGVDPNVADQMGDTDQNNLPWGTPFSMTSGGKKVPVVAGPGLSYMDLGSIPMPQTDWNTTFKQEGTDLVGRLNPFLKLAGEELTGVNSYTLQQHEDHNQGKYVTAPQWLPADFPGVKNRYNKKTGQMEKQVNWRVLSALNAAPFVNRLGKVGASVSTPGKATPALSLAGWLTGPKYSPVDPRQLELNDLYDKRAQIDSWITENQGKYKHAAGTKWTGPIGKAYKARSKVQKAIQGQQRKMGFKNIAAPGRPKGSGGGGMFGAPGSGSGMFGAGG